MSTPRFSHWNLSVGDSLYIGGVLKRDGDGWLAEGHMEEFAYWGKTRKIALLGHLSQRLTGELEDLVEEEE